MLVDLVVAHSNFLGDLLGPFLVGLHPLLRLAELVELALAAQPEPVVLPLLQRVVVAHEDLVPLLQETYLLAVLLLEVPIQVLCHASELAYSLLQRADVFLLKLPQILPVELEARADDLPLHGVVGVVVMLGHLLDESDHVSNLPQALACSVCSVLFTLFNVVADFISQVVDAVLLDVFLQSSHGLQATLLLCLGFRF